MLQNILFTKANLEKALDAAWLRNEVISNNIANVDTPGYKRKTVKFEEFLDAEMKTSRIQSGQTRLNGSSALVSEDLTSLSYREDGNNVDVEREMSDLAMNTLRYYTLIQKMNGDFQKLNSVIKGGR